MKAHGIKRERLVARSMVAAAKVVRCDQHQNQCRGGANDVPPPQRTEFLLTDVGEGRERTKNRGEGQAFVAIELNLS